MTAGPSLSARVMKWVSWGEWESPWAKASNHEGTGRAGVTSLAHPHLGCRSSRCEAWEEKPLPSIIGQVGSPFLISGCLPSPSPGPSGKLTMVFRPGELEQLDTGAWPLPFSHSV